MEPLPPVKEVEYRCYISKIFEELSGKEYMTFGFETAKEFSSFRYEIAVRYRITLEPEKKLEFKVLGMTATRTMMPAFGTARSVLKIPVLPFGVYEVRMMKSDGGENTFSLEVTKKGFQLLQPIPRKRFIDLVIEPKAAASGARHTSTVTKLAPTPLVPRTIQKRQANELTPEEQAILDSLRPETPEEREAREEAEAFGTAAKAKSAAKRPIDELNEVPMNAKHPAKEAPKHAHEDAKHAKEDAKHAKSEAKHAKEAPKAHAKAPEKKPSHKPSKSENPPRRTAAKPKPEPKRATKKPAPKKPVKAAAKPKPKAKVAPKKGKKK